MPDRDSINSSPLPPRSPLARGVMLAAVALWFAVIGGVCVVKYRTFLYTDFDLSIFSQALLGALHGRWFSSIRGMYWLGDHSSISLLALAPLAALWRSPLLLPLAQAAVLAAGAWPLFAYARRRLGDEPAAAMVAILWLLQPALSYLALFEFHPETIATTALLGTVAALAARRTRVALACAALAALAKEDAALPLAVLGVVTALKPGRTPRVAGLAIVAIAGASLVLSFAVLKPLLAHGEADYGAMYAAWGRTPREVLAHVLAHPGSALAAFVHTPGRPADSLAKAQLWLHLLGPVLGLALLAPLTLLPALPVFAEHVLAYRIEQHTIVFQYTALTLPFVMLASVDAVARLARPRTGGTPGARVRGRLALVLLAAVLAQALFGPFAPDSPLRAQSPTERTWPTDREASMARWREAFQRALPPHGNLVVDFPSLAQLSARDSLHSLHHVAAGRFTFSHRAYPDPSNVTGMLADLSALSEAGEIDEASLERVRHFVAAHDLHVVDAAGDLARLAPGSDTLAWLVPAVADSPAVRFDRALSYVGARMPTATVRAGDRLGVATRWRRDGALPGLALLQWAVTDARDSLREDEPRLLGMGLSSPAAWPAGATFEERTTWVVPHGLPPGLYALSFSMRWRNGEAEREASTPDPRVAETGGSITVGRFRVASR